MNAQIHIPKHRMKEAHIPAFHRLHHEQFCLKIILIIVHSLPLCHQMLRVSEMFRLL